MDMELDFPDMLFRTYINRNTRDFKTDVFTMAPVKTYMPPKEWNLDYTEFYQMIRLDDTYFYDTARTERPLSYVTVPAEMEEGERTQ